MVKNIINIILITCLIISCKKEKITDDFPKFIGTWIQQTDESIYHKLDIRNNSKGNYYECTNGPMGDCADTQFRKWRIKNNHLYYGSLNDLGEIMIHPTIASSDIILGNNDTIKSGKTYILLNYSYYVKQ